MAKLSTRQIVVNALQASNSPGMFNNPKLEKFINENLDVNLSELMLDSLGKMEFCIYIELFHQVTIVPDSIFDYQTLIKLSNAIEERLN